MRRWHPPTRTGTDRTSPPRFAGRVTTRSVVEGRRPLVSSPLRGEGDHAKRGGGAPAALPF